MKWVDLKRFIFIPGTRYSQLSSDTHSVQLVKKYERGDLPKSEWLDKLAFRRMEEIHAVCITSLF